MFSRFSVKKPLTVFVSVFMVIILGFVSFSSMTPDLLPGINLPYAVVITAYPGATPEEVEEQISQPLEQAMASLEDIDSISSTSSENYSMIMLSFNDDVNMDTMVSEIREKINGVSGYWDDMVQTPYIMKINPDVLPVTIASVEYDGLENTEVTQFVNDEILSDLEGITGVASVELDGDVTAQVNVVISQEKIDLINNEIKNSLYKEFAEGEQEIEDGKQEIADGKAEVEDGLSELDSATSELESGKDTLASETASALAELIAQKIVLEDGITELNSSITTFQMAIDLLDTANAELYGIQTSYNNIVAEKTAIEDRIAVLELALEGLNAEEPVLPEDESIPDNATELEALILQTNIELVAKEAELTVINTAMSALGYNSIDEVVATIDNNVLEIENLRAPIYEMEAQSAQLKTVSDQLTEGIEILNEQQLSGSIDIANGLAEIANAKIALESAQAQMETAEEQLDEAQEQLEEQKETVTEAATMEITMDMVSQLLVAQNFSMPVGYITEDNVEYLIRVGEKIDSVEELSDMAILNTGLDDIGILRLSDVADVFITDNADLLYSTTNGVDSLQLSFTKQSSYATKTVSDNVLAKFAELEEEYDGLVFSILTDQGNAIDLIVDNVIINIILGGALAILILILFLKDIRPTFVIACSIPISILLAIVLMYFSGITLNIISLSGLAIGVGMLVDNSVVVIENIHRLRTLGTPPLKAAVQGANQVAGAITASTFTTVCVFLPIVFIEGLTRQLFQDMALTVAYSLLASLIIALTLVPAMASGLLKNQKEKKSILLDKIVLGYGKIAKASLNHPWVVLVLSVVLLFGSTAIALAKGFIFMPSMSGTQITVTATAPEDATFEEKTVLADEIYEAIKDVEGIETYGVTVESEDSTSTSIMSMATGSSDITIYAIMADDCTRKDSEISAEILEKCADINAEITATGSMDMSSMLTSMGGEGVTIEVYGDDLDNLIAEANSLAEYLLDVEGVAEVSTGLEDSTPEIRIVVDYEKAMEEGLTVAQVYMCVSELVTSELTGSDVSIDGDTTSLVLYSEENENRTIEDVENMILSYQDMLGEDKEVALADVAEIIETTSLSSISRQDQRRTLSVSATINEDSNVTIVANAITSALNSYETLDGNTLEVTGESETIMEAINQLALMLALSIVIIYFIMVAQFQSFRLPFIVLFTIPLAFTGGFIGLLITGHEVSVISMVGFIMLAGIIVNNGIVLIDYINVLRLEGMEKKEAIILAGKTRMRPILMTALTTILGLLFMALATGTGSEMMQPMAIVCIGGLSYATLMTLFVIPAMYNFLSPKNMEKRIVD
ncbi:MAG: efflux RND transporter permease subunit [Clostridia bacterium]